MTCELQIGSRPFKVVVGGEGGEMKGVEGVVGELVVDVEAIMKMGLEAGGVVVVAVALVEVAGWEEEVRFMFQYISLQYASKIQ